MEAIKLQKVVKKDGEIRIKDLPFKKGQRIELILLSDPPSEEPTKATAKTMLNSGIVGLWRDRPISNSAEFARQLREEAQSRKN